MRNLPGGGGVVVEGVVEGAGGVGAVEREVLFGETGEPPDGSFTVTINWRVPGFCPGSA